MTIISTFSICIGKTLNKFKNAAEFNLKINGSPFNLLYVWFIYVFFFNFSLFLYCICCDGVVCVWMNSLVYLKIAGEKVGKTSNNSKINVLHHLYRWFYFCGIFFIYCIKLFIYTIQKVSLLFTSIKANMIHWK